MARFTHLLIERDKGLAAIPSAELPTLPVLARRACLFAVASLAFVLPPAVDDPALAETVPYFALLITLQLFPALWPKNPDLAAPPTLGIISAMASFGSLATFLLAGRIELAFVKGLDPDGAAALSRKVLLATSLGLASYYIGYYHPRLHRWVRRYMPRLGGVEWDPRRLRMVALGCFLVFVTCYVLFQLRLGVPLTDPTQLRAGKDTLRESPTLTWMIRGIQIGFLPVFLYFVDLIPRRKPVTLLLVLLGAVFVVYLSIRTGMRGPAFYALQALMICFHYLRQRISIGFFAVMLVLAVSANNVLYQWRTSRMGETATVAVVEERPMFDRVVSALGEHEGERQRFSVMALLIHEFPANYDYLLGESWLGLFAAFVPRWVWPEKETYFVWRDSTIVQTLGGGMNPSPFLGVLYVNFSWLGMVLGMILWGSFHRGLYQWLCTAPRDRTVVLMYTLVLINFAPTLLALSATIQYVLPMYLILRFIARPRSTAAPARATASAAA